MAEILVFRARPRKEHEVETRYVESAQILFFTGVRYMRMDDADANAGKTATTKTPRRSGKQTPSRRNPRKRA